MANKHACAKTAVGSLRLYMPRTAIWQSQGAACVPAIIRPNSIAMPRVRTACGLGLACAPVRSAPAALPAARTGTTAGAPASTSCEGVSRPPRAVTMNSVSAGGADWPGPGAYAREAAPGACAAGSAPSAAGEPALAAGSMGRPPVRARVRLYQLAGPGMRTVWRGNVPRTSGMP